MLDQMEWSQIKFKLQSTLLVKLNFKTSMLRLSLCDYSDEYILVKETIIVPKTGTSAAPNDTNKKVIFKNCAPFTDCITKLNNKEIKLCKRH